MWIDVWIDVWEDVRQGGVVRRMVRRGVTRVARRVDKRAVRRVVRRVQCDRLLSMTVVSAWWMSRSRPDPAVQSQSESLILTGSAEFAVGSWQCEDKRWTLRVSEDGILLAGPMETPPSKDTVLVDVPTTVTLLRPFHATSSGVRVELDAAHSNRFTVAILRSSMTVEEAGGASAAAAVETVDESSAAGVAAAFASSVVATASADGPGYDSFCLSVRANICGCTGVVLRRFSSRRVVSRRHMPLCAAIATGGQQRGARCHCTGHSTLLL